jgi:peptide/nickel transport system permease protein
MSAHSTITRPRSPRLLAGHPILRYTIRRVLAGILLLFVISILIFVATEVLPGDAAEAILGRNATPEALANLREQLDLDTPAVQRYFDWIGGVLQGDLGESLSARLPVGEYISDRVVNSLILALVTTVILIPLSIFLGVIAGTRRGRKADHTISGLSLTLISIPEFVTGTVLILLFAATWQFLPPISLVPPGASPFDDAEILILPVATLLLASLAATVRMMRAGVIEVMESDYIEMSRLNGIPERRLIYRYALRNALAPTVQVIALNVQWLVGGIVITETLFQYPGVGQLLVQAVGVRDIPLVQALALLIAAVYIALNIIADVLVIFLIPKLRTAQ